MNQRTALPEQKSVALTPVRTGVLQRKCACGQHTIGGAECAECRKKSEAALASGSSLQRAAVNREPVGEVPPIVYDVLRSPGQPLDAATSAFFEPRFGHDFSQVRVHTDARAAESAQAVNALAYTMGRDIVFGAGQYSTEGGQGRRLLAHELAHVIQQNGAVPKSQFHIGQPHDTYEEEADKVASALGNRQSSEDQPVGPALGISQAPASLQRLGANPTCTKGEADGIHQAIFDARGWLNKSTPKLEESPLSAAVLSSLRRNFGPTYGVAENAMLINERLKVARGALGRIPFACDTAGVTHWCSLQRGGWSVPGANASTICTNPPSTLSIASPYPPYTVLHESFHASMGFMTVDNYKGTPAFPGPGTQPLRNPDSYTHLVMDLS